MPCLHEHLNRIKQIISVELPPTSFLGGSVMVTAPRNVDGELSTLSIATLDVDSHDIV
jgi:hypothetical protein